MISKTKWNLRPYLFMSLAHFFSLPDHNEQNLKCIKIYFVIQFRTFVITLHKENLIAGDTKSV